MIAVIKTGGKQYKIKEGDTLKIEKVAGKEGNTIKFDKVLLVSDENGKEIEIGTPLIKNAGVSAKILEQGKAKKVSVVKYKPKTRYKRNVGHRQPFTKIQIESIKFSSSKPAQEEAKKEEK